MSCVTRGAVSSTYPVPSAEGEMNLTQTLLTKMQKQREEFLVVSCGGNDSSDEKLLRLSIGGFCKTVRTLGRR